MNETIEELEAILLPTLNTETGERQHSIAYASLTEDALRSLWRRYLYLDATCF